jgi:thymidylate synthase (FAD)
MKVKLIADNFFGLPNELLNDLGIVTFDIKGISRVVLAQLTRHRTFSFSVQSMRYVKQDEFITPYLSDNSYNEFQWFSSRIFVEYDDYITSGIKKQDARYILPLATTTNLIMTMPMMYAKNYFVQRLHKSAQPEHRSLASLMFKEIYNLTNNCDDEVIELWKHCLQDPQVVYYLTGEING